jgi:5-formyltetrahydrofolate cyclo-ligase
VVGAAYECQVVEEVPRERHDQDIDCLVTERGCRKFRREDGR